MFRFAFKQFVNNLSVFIGFFLTLFLTSVLLSTFSLLIINSIYASTGVDGKLQHPEVPIAIFSSLSSLILFLGFSALFNNINLAIKIQWSQFVLLRILGCTDIKIKFLIFIENLAIALLSTGLSLLIAPPLANLTINYMKSFGALETNFHLYQSFKYQWIYVLANLFLIILITYFATLKIKKISITEVNNNFETKTKIFNLIMRLGIGFIALGGTIALVSGASMENKVDKPGGAGSILMAIFCFIIAFGCLGKYFIRFLTFVLIHIFSYYLIKQATKAIMYNIKKFSFALVLFISLILFINYVIIFSKLNNTQDPQQAVVNNGFFLLLTIVVAVFDGVMVANATFQYFWNRQTEFKMMRKIGFSKIKVLLNFLIENLVLNLIAFLIGLVPIIFFSYQYFLFNNVNPLAGNLGQFFVVNTIIFATTITISMIPMVFLLLLKKI